MSALFVRRSVYNIFLLLFSQFSVVPHKQLHVLSQYTPTPTLIHCFSLCLDCFQRCRFSTQHSYILQVFHRRNRNSSLPFVLAPQLCSGQVRTMLLQLDYPAGATYAKYCHCTKARSWLLGHRHCIQRPVMSHFDNLIFNTFPGIELLFLSPIMVLMLVTGLITAGCHWRSGAQLFPNEKHNISQFDISHLCSLLNCMLSQSWLYLQFGAT